MNKNNETNIFETLYKINVNDYTEKKNGLTYLSWAYAWAEVKKLYPTANYTVYETPNGCIYHTDGRTCWVKTGVTIEGLEHIEYLPVMDYKNKSIPLENITSFDVNKAIQRSLTKALARHGLGLYIYAGEDLPENSPHVEEKKENNSSEEEITRKKLLTCIYNTASELLNLPKVEALKELQKQTNKNYLNMNNSELVKEYVDLQAKLKKKKKEENNN